MIQLREKRVHQPRLPTNMKARIIVPGQVAPAPCKITNISPAGARLQIETQWILPRSFWLRIVGDASLHYCMMVWRKGEEVGVDFRPDQRAQWWKQSQELNNRLPHRARF